MKYLTTDVEHLRHKFANATHLVFFILFFIYFVFIENAFTSRENHMCHVYLMEFHVNIAIVWY